MPAPAWEDLSVFFDPHDFGDSGVIHFAAGGTKPVRGLFDDPYVGAQVGEYTQDTTGATFTLAEADAVGVKRYDTLVIDGVTYDILTGPQGDGTGLATLKLAKQ